MKEGLDGMYEYKVYIKGEGIKEVKNREKKELYKKYSIKRYIKESKGLKVKIEIEGWKMKSKATKRDKKESKR